MRSRKHGVNHGQSKKQANSNARSAAIKTGPVKQNEKSSRRTKERSITEIIEKVSTWRKLYNGVMVEGADGTKQLQRWSLEDAADKVGVSKKSLDDYLL